MSHFYGEIWNNVRNTVSKRCGFKSGLNAHIRGWSKGVMVECSHNELLDKDTIKVYKTGGSNNSNKQELIAEV